MKVKQLFEFNMRKLISVFLTLTIVIATIPLTELITFASEKQSLEDFPPINFNGHSDFVIYKEGWRDNRIELALYNSVDENAKLILNPNWTLGYENTANYIDDEKYYIENNEWKLFENRYSYVSNHCTEVLFSSKDIYDADGNIILRGIKSNEPIYADAIEFNGHCYKMFDESFSWDNAKKECEKIGGHLVTINSKEEQEFLVDMVKSSTKKNMWIGAYPSNGNYRWITGEQFSYTNWAPEEPNNVFDMQNAAMMYTQNATYPAGTWNDENENGRNWTGYYLSDFGYICEWGTENSFIPSIQFGATASTLGQEINGYIGEDINALLAYKSPTENIASLEITSSNTDIVEIGTIKIGVGDYITSENEHMATVPLKLKAEGTSTITITSPEGVSESVTVTVSKPLEAKKSIAVFTTEKSLSVKTGDSMWLAFGLMNEDTGLVEEDWRKMAITVSDPTIISLSDYEETKYGYSLEVIGKKEGATNVTITDTETGINTIIVISVYDSFVQTYSYAIDDMKVFYPNNQWEDHIATNIYNLNGIYVNNYQCIKNGNTYNIDFDVYNSRYYAGSVDIYDESGMWLGYEEINKYSDISSLWDTGEQAFYLISNTIALIPGGNDSNLLTYEQESFSKHTHISLQIPEGGYFTISNNVGTSPGTFFINAFEILFDGAYTALDLATSDSVKASALSGFKKSAAKSLADRLIEARNEGLKDEVKKKAQKVLLGTMQSEINKIAKKFSQAELKDQLTATDDICSEMANLAENILNSYNISWKHLFQSATGVGESFFTQFAGPAGVALKGCFAITKSTNKLLMATQMAASTPKPYVTVYSEIEKGYINPYGVIVNTAGNMDSEAVLQVFRVSNDDAVDVILDSNNPLEKHELYNICFVKDDQLVQPSGKVAVYIPIPEGMNSNTCKVYRQESDGSWTILDAHIEGNYLVFETDHFSLYSVIGDMDSLSIYSMPNKVVYSNGDTLDTDGLVLNLNGELISEGFICEPTVLSGVGNLKITVRYGNATTDFYVRVKALGGYTISGNAVSFGSQEENCVLCLIDKSGVVEEIEAVDGNYVFENIASGTYTLAVSKTNHVIRTYKITVANEDITQDVKIHLLGDINGDGKVNTIDVNRAYAHVRETNLLSGYELECANVAGTDETVNTVDINRIYAHVKGTKLLW